MFTFNLKKEWFEKIKSGEKTHEYREAKPYWNKRASEFEVGSIICFACGYPKASQTAKRMLAVVMGVTIRNGLNTDLKIDKSVFDIEFELIKGV